MNIDNLDEILESNENFIDGLTLFLESDISTLLFDENDELNTLYNVFKESKNNEGLLVSIAHKTNANLLDILNISPLKEDMKNIVKTTFNEVNPYTGLKDVPLNAFYSSYIPLIFFCKVLPPQIENNKLYFNTNGSITVAEFLDSINAIFNCYNSVKNRKDSIDGVSISTDFFNEGYNLFVKNEVNPMYNLYSRYELLRPITRIELGYLIVCCLYLYRELFGELMCETYTLGNSFDWLNPIDILSEYEDGLNYGYALKQNEDNFSIDIKDYKKDYTLGDYIEKIKEGNEEIPLPMLMSLLELGEHDLFYFSNSKLEPLNEVSRGELCYTLVKLCNYLIERQVDT